MTAAQKKHTSTTHRPPGRPRRVDSEQHVDTASLILAQAGTLFAERGFSAVSINDIVAAAEVSKPTLYYYFPDKEALYSAVLVEIIGKAGASFQETLSRSMPLREKLVALTEKFFEHAPASLPCLLRDVAQHLNPDSSGRVLDLYRTLIYKPFEDLFQESMTKGELKPVQNPRLLTELFLTMLDWLTLRFSFHEGPPLDPRDKASQVVNLFLEGAAGQKLSPTH